MKIPKLLSEDLIEPRRRNNRILSPYEIPIHPRVYNSDFAYTKEFMEEVRARMPQALRDDISRIEIVLGIDLGITITDESILEGSYEIKFKDIDYEAKSQERQIGVEVHAANTFILPHLSRTLEIDTRLGINPILSHPLPPNKILEYSFDSDGDYFKFYSWYTHHLHDVGEGFFHYLRAFAIEFNNHGLSKL